MDVTKTEHKRNNINRSKNLLYQIVFTERLLVAQGDVWLSSGDVEAFPS